MKRKDVPAEVSKSTVRLKQVKFHHNNSTYVQVKLYPYGMQNSQLYVKFHQDNIGKKLTCIGTVFAQEIQWK
jgi:hypothetical protein